MANLYKQFAESVTKWEIRLRSDEFFVTRVRLTALYTLLSVIFLCAFSVALFESLINRLTESVGETILDSGVRSVLISRAGMAIKNLIFLGDLVVLIIIVLISFFLIKKTLAPIKKTMEKQNRFIADASHELRTPLAVMKTGIEVHLRRKDLSVENARGALSDTLKEINLMTELSNNLLSISKGHLSDITLTKIYLPDILQRKIERLKHIAEEKNITLTLSGFDETRQGNEVAKGSAQSERNIGTGTRKFVMGNDFMLSQAFYNLIHNAIIYTPDGGSVKVDYAVRGDKYIVHISDTGIGISKEALTHIFEPFYRGDNSRVADGSGLGLSIVRSHISFHRGAIAVKGELGKGARFTVALPVV